MRGHIFFCPIRVSMETALQPLLKWSLFLPVLKKQEARVRFFSEGGTLLD